MARYGKKPLLQLALDLPGLDEAIKVGEECREHVDIMEVGTPLLKSEGVKAVLRLRESFPDKLVFADTKTMDMGGVEAEMVFDAGADIMSVCAAAPLETLIAAVEVARDMEREVLLDCIGAMSYKDVFLKASLAEPHLLCIHRGVDERRSGAMSWEEVTESVEEVLIPLAVAGGIKPADIEMLVNLNPAVITVGSYISASPRPALAVRDIRRELDKFFYF